ncbi:hypothetical protein H4R21_002225 [Coemansia helicoidea]|uniref:Uncharacterized protein n=1 Tax=Coemansia helicoidea TaxID=1286919 RepID=A0ACC1L8E2_9FUNG|nr:hypothetical protein H4R21_002225 [Coemansia helicoidea]
MAGPGGIGPQIPPEVAARLGIRTGGTLECAEPSAPSRAHRTIGPAMPPGADVQPPASPADSGSEREEEAAVGPAAELAGCSAGQARQQTLSRLEAQMERSSGGSAADEPSSGRRGEWMLVPPTRKGGDGLFDESWTQTPEERARQAAKRRAQPQQPAEEDTPAARRAQAEDADKAKWVDEFNRANRPKSLLEMHRESQHAARHPRRARDARSQPSADHRRNDRHDRDRQRAVLDAMGALGDKYAPGKGGSFM